MRAKPTCRAHALVIAAGVALTASACSQAANSQPAVTTAASNGAPVGELVATAPLDPELKYEYEIPRLVLTETTRTDASNGIHAARLDAGDNDVIVALQQLDLERDIGVVRIQSTCGWEALPLEVTAGGSRLLDRHEPDGSVCDAESIVAALWIVPRDQLADEFSIGETIEREPGDVRAVGDTLVAPEVFDYAAFENEPAGVAEDPAAPPTVTVSRDDADIADILDRAGNRPDLGLESDPAAYLGVTVETGGGACTVPSAALNGRRLSLWHPAGECTEDHVPRRTTILVPLDRLGDEVVIGFGEHPDEADELVTVSSRLARGSRGAAHPPSVAEAAVHRR